MAQEQNNDQDAIEAGTGSLAVKVLHTDGSLADPDDFFPKSWEETPGYFSLTKNNYDSYDGGDTIDVFPTCNYSNSCTIDSLPAGKYTASIMLRGGFLVLEPESREFSQDFTISSGNASDIRIIADYGYVQLSVLQVVNHDLEQLLPSLFKSFYSFRLGYYSIYDQHGNYVMDALSCNLDLDSCTLPLGTGKYDARLVVMVNAESRTIPKIYSIPFEVTDNEFVESSIVIEQTDTVASSNNVIDPATTNSNSSTSPRRTAAKPNPSSTVDQLRINTTSVSGYLDEDGYYHLIGEVENTGKYSVHDVFVHSTFYGPMQGILAIKRGHSLVEVIDPKEGAPFEVLVKDAGIGADIRNYTLSVTSTSTQEERRSYLGLNVTDHFYSDETGKYHIRGKVYNYAGTVTNLVKFVASFYDRNNTLIFLNSTFYISQLNPLSSHNFEIVSSLPPTVNQSRIGSVSVIVQSEEYVMVKSGMLQSPIAIEVDAQKYENGLLITLNGTVGKALSSEPFAVIDIIWPDGFHYDRELARVSSDEDGGAFRKSFIFYSLPEFDGETFTVRVIYASSFGESTFQSLANSNSTAGEDGLQINDPRKSSNCLTQHPNINENTEGSSDNINLLDLIVLYCDSGLLGREITLRSFEIQATESDTQYS